MDEMRQAEAQEAFGAFVETIAALRGEGGCPWDRAQTHASIARNMLEEAYEAVDAIESGDAFELCAELGDVLLQVVLQAQMAQDAGEFCITDVVEGANAKMIRRHPHVFGSQAAADALGVDLAEIETPGQVSDLWDRIKLIERAQTEERRRAAAIAAGRNPDAPESLMDSVPRSQPALLQTHGIVRKAASAGFFWEDADGTWDKVSEELGEVREALAERDETSDAAHAQEEFGDLLFTLVCVAHQEGIDAEMALGGACEKFRRRWANMEQGARRQGRRVEELSLAEQDALWDAAKAAERANGKDAAK